MSGARRSHEEDDIQEAVCGHLALRGVPNLIYFAVPNGGRRNAREAARLKRQGVTPGVSDLILLHKGMAYALEIKTKKGWLSNLQANFLHSFERAGGRGQCVFGIDEALNVLTAWGLIK